MKKKRSKNHPVLLPARKPRRGEPTKLSPQIRAALARTKAARAAIDAFVSDVDMTEYDGIPAITGLQKRVKAQSALRKATLAKMKQTPIGVAMTQPSDLILDRLRGAAPDDDDASQTERVAERAPRRRAA